MISRVKFSLPLAIILLLSVIALSGCGGSGDDGGLVPAGIVRFRDVSSDYNGGSTDLDTTSGSIVPGQNSTVFFSQTSNGRTVGVTLPVATLTAGTTYKMDRTVTNSLATYNASVDGSTDTYDWISNGGTVRVVSVATGSSTIRLDGVKFVRNTETTNGSLGTFTLNGTITGVPVLTLAKTK